MALIYADESGLDGLSAEERAAITARYRALADEARASGVFRGGEQLASIQDATTVRVREAQPLVVDGPYAEAKEVLGGYFIFDCDSMDDAIAWAERIPAAERAGVEVRPVYGDHSEA
jgi:hypothetical protein